MCLRVVSSDGLEHSVDTGKVIGSNPIPPTLLEIFESTLILNSGDDLLNRSVILKISCSLRVHRRFLDYFERRYQLIIPNVENFAEHITPPFSYATIITVFLSWFCTSLGFSLWLAKTVLARWMNPIYIETENQNIILSLATTVEALEEQIGCQTKFIATLQKIIQGKSKDLTPHITSSTIPEPIKSCSNSVIYNSTHQLKKVY